MADKAHKITDKLLQSTEKEIHGIYDEAAKEAQKKVDEFFQKFAAKDAEKKALVDQCKLTKAEYEAWRKGKMLAGTRYTAMADALAADMTNANQIAANVINGHLPDVYATNYNWSTYDIEQKAQINTNFALYDRQTVERLIRDKPDLLPMKAGIDIPADKKWNKQKINGAITQGILLGESIPDISKRLTAVTDMNRTAAVRNARTMTTSAENAGRKDSYKRAQDMGIKIDQEWLASPDSRTRHEHRMLHGQVRKIGEPFEVEGYEIEFPGDPKAEPFLVYNCRCTTVSIFKGFDHKKMDDYVKNTPMTYYDWETSHMKEKMADTLSKIDKSKKKISKMASEQLENVWKDPVTVIDYPAKKDKIQAKKDYFIDQMSKYPEGSPEHEKFKKLLEELEEYEKNGEKYLKELAKQQKLQGEVSGIKSELVARGAIEEPKGRFADDLYTPEAKAAAKSYKDRHDADVFHRDYLDSVWGNLEKQEQYSVWEYTHNSNPINKSLSGYHETWYRSDFIGAENTIWGYEDKYRDITIDPFKPFGENGHVAYFDVVTGLTKAIEKSEMPESVWLIRGSDRNGLAGMIEGLMSFDEAKLLLDSPEDDIKAALIGQRFRNEAFTSTGISTDTGFSGQVSYRIFAPQGTKAIYAEPQSYYGNTSSRDFYSPGMSKRGVGSEAEVILQRGTPFRVADVKKSTSGSIEIELEVVEQPDYFVTGAENTFDGGKTSHTK